MYFTNVNTSSMSVDSCLPFLITSSLLKIQSHYLKMLFHQAIPDHALESHALKHELDTHAGGPLIVFMYQLSELMYLGTGQSIPML